MNYRKYCVEFYSIPYVTISEKKPAYVTILYFVYFNLETFFLIQFNHPKRKEPFYADYICEQSKLLNMLCDFVKNI